MHRLLIAAAALSLFALGGCTNSCFAAGTRIDTPDGPVPIETLEVGDTVWSFDHASGERRAAEVLHTFVHHGATVREMQLNDGRTLRVTDEHPIYSAELGRYVEAAEFSVGSALVGDGETTLAAWGAAEEGVTVYNIEVEGSHNYFAEGVLVHNKSPREIDATIDTPMSDAGPSDADTADVPALRSLGEACTSFAECASAVCWDFSERDPACSGTVCSETCTEDAQCIELARAAGAASPDAALCDSPQGCNLVGTGLGIFLCR